MEEFYKVIGGSRQKYALLKKSIKKELLLDQKALDLTKQWRIMHPAMGARPLFYSMKNVGLDIGMGINKFEKLLRNNGLNASIKTRKFPITSDGKAKESFPNLTNGLELNDINQLIVGDITYYWLINRWAYLFCLKDVYSQRILSIVPALNLFKINAILCLKQAGQERGKIALNGCIHHSDYGSQYDSIPYKNLLINDYKMKISRADNCKQNGSAEQLNHIIKNMYLHKWKINSFDDLVKACKILKQINNEQRAIYQLNNLSPVQFEQIIQSIPIEKRPIKKLYDFNQ